MIGLYHSRHQTHSHSRVAPATGGKTSLLDLTGRTLKQNSNRIFVRINIGEKVDVTGWAN